MLIESIFEKTYKSDYLKISQSLSEIKSMNETKELMKKSEYSDKAIEYYLKKVNVGQIEKPTVHLMYTGPCGDTMEIYIKIESNVIKEAKFQTVGCVGTFSSGSALMELVRGKNLEEVKKISDNDIINFLGGLPKQKIHCTRLAQRTLQKTIEKYREEN